MSVITLFTKTAPTIAGVEFDAVLEDTFEMSSQVTDYPIESGARASDHVILEPFRWSLVGAVSNNPLKPVVTDFLGSGLLAGLLSASNGDRASDALTLLIDLATPPVTPFDIDAGDIQLSNMVITNLTRTKNPENEQGLIFVAQLQEFTSLDTLVSVGSITQDQLLDGDPSKSQATELINRGEQILRDAGQSIRNAIGGIFG